MVLNAAVQMLREAEELKQNILKFKSETSMLQERSLWTLQQQLQKIYQKVLILDLDYALDKKVEQDLWNVGFKQQIEALQTISKDRKSPLRSEGQAMLSWVLQAAAGFYLGLLHQICTAFKLDLPFRRRASLLGWVEGWSPGPTGGGPRLPPPAAARYICQHCLVHLGDLARYRQQPRVAYTFYRHALVVSTHSGQPYNQLALLARRRGRRLGALYWHVRAILVRAPFPPAPANLARTLQALAGHVPRDVPVLRGARKPGIFVAPAPPPRLDAHAHETELLRALHAIHSGERLDLAEQLVETLNTSLTSLVATDCFESITLVKMMCVLIWLVHHTTDELSVTEEALSESEASAAALSQTLAVGALLALLLPSHTAENPPSRALPALKVCLQWVALYPQLLDSAPFQARPQIWHALAHTLNKMADDGTDKCESVPLPEDEELHGFQPLEQSFEHLKFSNHATWDTYGRRLPDAEDERPWDQDVPPPSVVSPACLDNDPELEASVRAHRLIKLGLRLAELRPEQFSVTTDDNGVPTFTALCHGGDQLSRCVAALRQTQEPQSRDQTDDDDAPLPPPIVISEADFREKVRDKRVGILKPQGSLERAREERALATADDQDLEDYSENSKNADRREQRRPRVNIAMAAILRKQEESCKQVKFITPPPVPEGTETETASEAPIVIENLEKLNISKTVQAKPKSLSDIPSGRQTGGILKLKDNSGYPHLANPDMKRKEEIISPPKDPKVIQPPTQKQRDGNKWQQQAVEQGRPGHRNYGLQTTGITYSPHYQAPTRAANTSIRLPVVNPKEIDISALRQTARPEYSYPHRSNYPLSSDKKNFLRDLPPRFANQRFTQESEENKFRDPYDTTSNVSSNLFNMPVPHYLGPLLSPPQVGTQRTPQAPGQLPGQLPSQLLTQHSGQLSTQHPGQLSTQHPGQLSTQHPGQLSTQHPGQLSTQHSDQLSTRLPGQLSTQHPGQLPTQHLGQLTTQHSGQLPTQHPGQLLGHVSIPPYPPPALDYMAQWWQHPAFNPSTTTATVTSQQLYAQSPQMASTGYRPDTTESTHNVIGQMPARHYENFGFRYQNLYEQFNRGIPEQGYPAPPQDFGRHIGLPAPNQSPPSTYDSTIDVRIHFRRRKDGLLERVPDEDPPPPDPVQPIDLTLPKMEERESRQRDAPAEEDPGTYSLFSGAAGAVTWGTVTQQEQDTSLFDIKDDCSFVQPRAIEAPEPEFRHRLSPLRWKNSHWSQIMMHPLLTQEPPPPPPQPQKSPSPPPRMSRAPARPPRAPSRLPPAPSRLPPSPLWTSPLSLERSPLSLEPSPLAWEPPPLSLEPPPLAWEPPPFVLEHPPLLLEPSPLSLEPPPLSLEPPPLSMEPPPLSLEPPSLAWEPPPFVLKRPSLFLEPPSVEAPPFPLVPLPFPLKPRTLAWAPPPLAWDLPPFLLEPPPFPLEPQPLAREPPPAVRKPIPLVPGRERPPHAREPPSHAPDPPLGVRKPIPLAPGREWPPHAREPPPHGRDLPQHAQEPPPHAREPPPHAREPTPHAREPPPLAWKPPPYAREPVTYAREPVTYAREPVSHAQEPPPHAREPTPYAREPVSYARKPVSHAQEPPPHAREPPPLAWKPPPHAREPVSYAWEPLSHAGEPPSHAREPPPHARESAPLNLEATLGASPWRRFRNRHPKPARCYSPCPYSRQGQNPPH